MVDASPGGTAGAPIDRYVVLEYLSEGGMGAIYLGKKLGAGGFEKEVVLKQLLPEFTSQPEFIDLFLREARLSANLDHANIIHTIDLVAAGSEYFIVMEYLAGADLRTLLKRVKRMRARLSPAAALYIGREILSALAYAHNKIGPDGRPLRLIHRDVSPSNILVSQGGEVKLTDFGIAKAATHNSVFYRVKGKVGYMSPEQARNEALDHRSDLYSLAVVLYEMITGERLFVHAGLTSTPEQIYGQPIPLVSRKVEGLPADLDKVMLKALSIDPDARYQSAGELQEAILRVAHRHGLLMSAPEVAAHLRKVCGPPERWRDLESERAGTGGAAGGTEVYDMSGASDVSDVGEGTAQLSLDDLDEEDFGPASGLAPLPPRAERAKTSLTHLSRLQGMELTSMINLAGVEQQGAKPLVDLSAELDVVAGRAIEPRSPRPREPEARSTTGVPVPPAEPTMRVPSARPFSKAPTPRPVVEPEVEEDAPRRRWGWLIAALIVLAAAAAAAAIGLSGPSVPAPAPEKTSGGSASPP
jgi:serine/threonine protein kinase